MEFEKVREQNGLSTYIAVTRTATDDVDSGGETVVRVDDYEPEKIDAKLLDQIIAEFSNIEGFSVFKTGGVQVHVVEGQQSGSIRKQGSDN